MKTIQETIAPAHSVIMTGSEPEITTKVEDSELQFFSRFATNNKFDCLDQEEKECLPQRKFVEDNWKPGKNFEPVLLSYRLIDEPEKVYHKKTKKSSDFMYRYPEELRERLFEKRQERLMISKRERKALQRCWSDETIDYVGLQGSRDSGEQDCSDFADEQELDMNQFMAVHDFRIVCEHEGPCSLLHESFIRYLKTYRDHLNALLEKDWYALHASANQHLFLAAMYGYTIGNNVLDFKRMQQAWFCTEILGKRHSLIYGLPWEQRKILCVQKLPRSRSLAKYLKSRLAAIRHFDFNVGDVESEFARTEEEKMMQIPQYMHKYLAFVQMAPRTFYDTETGSLGKIWSMYNVIRRRYRVLKNKEMNEDFKVRLQSWFSVKHEHEVKLSNGNGLAADQLVDSISKSLNSVAMTMSGFRGVDYVRTALMNFLSFVTVCFTSGSYVSSLCAFQLLLSTMGFQLLELPSHICSYIEQLCTGVPKGGIHLQSAESSELFQALLNVIPIVGGLFFVVCTAILAKSIPTQTGIDQVIRRMKDLPNAFRGMSDIYTFFSDKIKGVVQSAFGFMLDKEKMPIDPFKEIERWMSEVSEICVIGNMQKLSYDADLVTKVSDLYNEGMKMNESFLRLKIPSSDLQVFRQHFMMINSAMTEARRSAAGGMGPRVEPLLVQFVGESGVGKSTVSWAFIADWFKQRSNVTDSKQMYERVYFRKVGQEFWDGMTSQKDVIVYDDAGTLRDSVAQPNKEFLEAIYTANIAPYPVHMASLYEKANTFFQGKLIIWTTNKTSYDTPSLTNPEALKRRIDLLIRVEVREDYRVKGGDALDSVKAGSLTNFTDAYQFSLLNKNDPNFGVIAGPMSYDDVWNVFLDAYDSKIDNSSKIIKLISNRVNTQGYEVQSKPFTPYVLNVTNDCKIQSKFGFIESEKKINAEVGRNQITDLCKYITTWRDSWNERTLHPSKHVDVSGDDFNNLPYIRMNQLFANGLNIFELMEVEKDKYAPLSDAKCYSVSGDTVQAAYALHVTERMIRQKLFAKGLTNGQARSWLVNFMLDNMNAKAAVHTCTCSCENAVGGGYGVGLLDKIMQHQPEWSIRARVFDVMFSAVLGICATSLIFFFGRKITGFFGSNKESDHRAHVLDTQTVKVLAESFQNKDNATASVALENINTESHQNKENTTVTAKLERPVDSVIIPRVVDEDSFQENVDAIAQQTVILQGVVDSGCVELLSKLAYSNMYRMERWTGDKWVQMGIITFIRNRDAITNSHFLEPLSQSEKFRIWSLTRPTPQEFSFKDLQYTSSRVLENNCKYRDVCMLRFPRTLMPHPDITSRFVSAGEAGYIHVVDRAYLIGPSHGVNAKPFMKYYCTSDVVASDGCVVDEKTKVEFRQFYQYPIDTVGGDCGCLLLQGNTSIRGKIFGLHFAGRDKTHYSGLATPLTIEFIEQLAARFPPVNDLSPIIPEGQPVKVQLGDQGYEVVQPIGGEVVYHCTVPTVHCARKTNIIPSILYDVFDAKCAPAALMKVDGKDPRILSLAKVGMPVIKGMGEFDDAIYNDMLGMYSRGTQTTKRIFSLSESIRGADDCLFFSAICRSTSSGYGWGSGSKHQWLGSDENFITDHPRVVQAVEARIERAKQGLRTETIWIDTLKDERRPLEKVQLLKTRTFAVGPLDYNLVFRMYFGAFMNNIMTNRIDNECCVGTNVYSADWHKIAERIRSRGENLVAGDFSNFDGTLNADILWRLCDMINDWYDDGIENAKVREVLFAEIVHSLHICDGIVYGWTHSQPSGNPATVILNSMYNSYVMRYAFLCSVPEKFKNMSCFNKNITMVNYGDDNVLNVSSMLSCFSQNAMSSALQNIGMTYTDEAKSGLSDFRTIGQISFLKRGFRWDEQRCRFVAPLNVDTIQEMVLWTKKGQDNHYTTAVNVSTAAMEASFHGKVFFENFIAQIRPHLHKVKIAPTILSFKEYLELDMSTISYGSGMVDLLNPKMGFLSNDGEN
jgi:hypothetical protein